MFFFYFLYLVLIQRSELLTTTRRLPPTLTTAKYNPCKSPDDLYTSYSIPIVGLNSFIKKGSFNLRPNIKSFEICNSTLYNVPNMAYKFRLVRNMYFEIKMTGPNSDMNIDSILGLYDLQCNSTFFCGDNEYVKTARLNGRLSPGQYVLIATVASEKNIKAFELEISFNISKLEPSPYIGSCQKPINLTKVIPINGTMGKIEGYLSQYYNKDKLSCSLYNSSSVVFSFIIPDSSLMLGYIAMQGIDGINKMDTLLALADSNCNEINDECDDDNVIIGGLSSFLNLTLTPGEYRILASGHDQSVFGPFVLSYSFTPINKFGQLGSCFNPFVNDSIFAQNLTNYEVISSFIKHEYEIQLSCSNGESSTYYYVVMSLKVPKDKYLTGSIELSGLDDNKMDTYLELKDKFCHPLMAKNSCNDDSQKIGGLSSNIEGIVPSGDYLLVLGFLGKNEPSLFKLKFNTIVY